MNHNTLGMTRGTAGVVQTNRIGLKLGWTVDKRLGTRLYQPCIKIFDAGLRM